MDKNQHHFLQGGGEMGALIRSFNWDKNPLGNPENWSSSLKTLVSMMLTTNFPVLICWGKDFIQLYNDNFRPINGITKHPDALGGTAKETYAEIWDTIGPMFESVMQGETFGFPNFKVPLHRNGYLEDCYFDFSYSPIRNENGETDGVLVICNEKTRQVNAFKELKQAKQELDFAIGAAELGTWDLDPSTNKFIGNERLKSWFGLSADEEIDLNKATDVIAEEDRSRVLADIAQAQIYKTGGQYDTKYHIINPEYSTPRRVWAKGKALFNENKEVIRFSGILQDITSEHNILQELRDSNRQLELALEQSSLSKIAAQLGTFDMDLEKNTMEWDDRCRFLFGINHQNEVSYQHDFTNGLHPDDRERVLDLISDVYIKSKTNGDYDVEYRTVGAEDHKIRWIRAKGKAYFDAQDKPIRFIGSVLDITEQKSDELRKNDFIGMVSHELKTPLTSLKAYIQILKAKANNSSAEFVADLLQRSEAQVKKMTSLINGFLNISKLESGKISLEKEDFNLTELVDELIAEFRILASSHELVYHSCPVILINGDRDKLGSVISNLISNAIKYSPIGSTVEIECKKTIDKAMISVSDQGIGISENDKDKLFERYYRVENKNTKTISGFGIGLYVSAEIMHRHESKIQLESHPGKGSKFFFELLLKL
ncbi:hypothetical protein HDF26_001662 [Pedobacter cryoconitis]|uniref:PAS domain-containing sensor histidine kinase n=1 Tax=Pedobacter cryoconitis TaxID=188932 RepID=UPI00160A6C83|nr:PAS domain-containing sensor histidine kinase [Pedobacter cryoconitis]MBB6271235.1 hypothetical protein [Pedobacter cryoconitis]